jgi:hypothetical protein
LIYFLPFSILNLFFQSRGGDPWHGATPTRPAPTHYDFTLHYVIPREVFLKVRAGEHRCAARFSYIRVPSSFIHFITDFHAAKIYHFSVRIPSQCFLLCSKDQQATFILKNIPGQGPIYRVLHTPTAPRCVSNFKTTAKYAQSTTRERNIALQKEHPLNHPPERIAVAATLCSCIREEVFGSNLGRYTGQPEVFVVFLIPSTQIPG